MTTILSFLFATLATLPILAWYGIYITSVKRFKNKKRAIRLASDFSAVWFVVSVYFISYEIWSRSFFWFISLTVVLIAMIFTWVYWRVANDLVISKLFRGILRMNFIVFFLLYVVLSGYGVLYRIFFIG
ncbi:DUF3397 domain-containing protein [Alkalihalobacillus pseudalcaliphilus]|uniref:DUF3397 domain-containing protein n=1 Tax=Alkalihalobacillus pseudalcaliphilus TaxID=79884 RepID=UPI00064DF36F|nr:DUF3397 domain-containing protein [Alkalihalobacillus pseudalcaliphilus]KMK77108.1 hypothetical protein AB990_06035 [Alkalihalobacillus pseudalcaliphilus]